VKLKTFSEEEEITSIEFHPDGLMLAIGFKNGLIKLYDIRTNNELMKIDDKVGYGEVTSLAFSNKGLLIAASWSLMKDCLVYSLRKMNDI